MKLLHVQPQFVDQAWRDGADRLAEACATSGGEVTGDQLKMLLARGERSLFRLDCEDKTVGWGVVRVDQLPNVRVLHVCELYAPNGHFEAFIGELKALAASLGCSEIRCSAKPAQARLYRAKLKFEPVYETLRLPCH